MRNEMRTPRPATRKGGGPIVLAVLVIAGVCVRAVLADEPAAIELPPVVVERERSVAEHENPRDTTGAVTEIPREELSRPGENLDQVLDRQAGVSAVRLGGLGDFSAASIRGSSFDQVSVFLDGIPLNAGLGGAVDLSALPPAHLEKIEIYRGFAPVEATTSALGGALFLTTREIRESLLEARAGYGSFNTIEAGLFGAHRSGETRFLAGLDYLHSRSDFSFLNDGGTPANPADDFRQKFTNRDFDRIGVLLKLAHDLNADTTVSLAQDFYYREGGLQRGGAVVTSGSRLQTFRSITGMELLRNRLFYGGDRLKVQVYNTFARVELEDFSGEIRGFPQNDVKKSYSPGTAVSYRAESGPVAGTGFLSYRYERYSPRHRIPTTFADGTSTRHSVTAAAGGEFQVPEWRLLIAPQYRFERNADSFRPASNSNPMNPPVEHSSADGHTFRAGLLWKPVETVKLRANAGRAYRFPSLFELFGDTGLVAGNSRLKPESGYNWDAGLEAGGTAGPVKLSSSMTYFRQDTDNLIQFVRSTVVTRPENVDSAAVQGIEAMAVVDGWQTVRIEGAWTWLDSRISSADPARDGRKSPNRPPNQWTLTGTFYRTRAGSRLNHAELWTRLEFTSSHFVDGNNKVSVPERTILGAGTGFRMLNDRLVISFEARNLTDEKVMDVVGFPLPGRSFFGRLEWKFNPPKGDSRNPDHGDPET